MRDSIAIRRDDHAVIKSVDMPTISRIGRLLRPSTGTSANRSDSRCPRWASRRVLYSSEAATVNRCTGWPSRASQRMTPLASTVATLLEIATWVCRSGSPARESRWVKAAPRSPVVSTWATPLVPDRVNAAWVSNHFSASATAASWHSSTTAATSIGAIAHNADTDFTGEKVRS